MQLKKKNAQVLKTNQQNLKTVQRGIQSKTKKLHAVKDRQDITYYLTPSERKKWERLSPKKKEYYVTHGSANTNTDYSGTEENKKCSSDNIKTEKSLTYKNKKTETSGNKRGWSYSQETVERTDANYSGNKDTAKRIAPSDTKQQGTDTLNSGRKKIADKAVKRSTNNVGKTVEKAADKIPLATVQTVKTAEKTARKVAEFFSENLRRDEMTREQLQEEARRTPETVQGMNTEIQKQQSTIGRLVIAQTAAVAAIIGSQLGVILKVFSLFVSIIVVCAAPFLLILLLVFGGGANTETGTGNSEIVSLALSKVGCSYSQANRDGEGSYDCSSLVYRLYAEIGINYLSGMTAAGEAKYLEEHGMGIVEAELQPGDLIFYSYQENGRYKNISHVAIYIGNEKMVHAANTKRGVVCDPYRPSNIGVYARPQ